MKDQVHPYCESCFSRGFGTQARVMAGGKALCIGCHIDYEKAQEELLEAREREQTAWTQTR